MLNSEVSQLRSEEKLTEFKIAFSISAIRLIGPLYPLFWIADLLHTPSKSYIFLTLRLSVTFFCFALYYSSKKINQLRKIENLSILLMFYPSLIIDVMIILSDGIGSVYFVGLNLIAAGAICFFPWNKAELIKVILAIYGPYFLLPLIDHPSAQEINKFIVNLFFITGTILISCVIRFIYEKLKFKELELRLQLNNEIIQRNEIIRIKTEEGVKLSSLSKQFSPQVIEAINKGKLNQYSLIQKTKICCIFIDIVNSTDRVTTINKEDLNKVLSFFMSDTIKILLKYDITIDKFLGDGVLAFSNAPVEISDYINRVIIASIEIISKIKTSEDRYKELWKKDFQIRIGIDCGFADVGFYGSDEYFKTFTAIGDVVNMSSRLCSISEPDTIFISSTVYNSIKNNPDYIITDRGLRHIKGFEKNMTPVYQVSSNKQYINSDVPECPHKHGILSLDIDQNGIYKFLCKTCGYEKNESTQIRKAS